MTFISYAQNFEDVMLWRALKSVERGFYVDVGACDPVLHSVSKAFYDRGWRGINIEPTAQYHRLLQQQRPDDINLRVAVAAQAGEVPLYEIADTGLSTLDRDIARQHEAAGWAVRETRTRVATLTEVLAPFRDRDVHFLKIDVEGAEAAVLQGMDFSAHRPWIVLVEAVLPLAQTPSHGAWEPCLNEAGYRFVYFDGISRFYVANERPHLAAAFALPPNRHFDGFLLASEGEVAEKRREGMRLAIALRMAEEERRRLDATLAQTRLDLEDVLQSRSWRITKPLRAGNSRIETTLLKFKRASAAILRRVRGGPAAAPEGAEQSNAELPDSARRALGDLKRVIKR